MCPKGHNLLLGSDSVFGRWRWAAHARRCSACAEVRAAARFVEAFAARAGRWPVAGEAVRARGVRRAWKLAGALAVVALLLPLAGSVVWRTRQGRFHPPVATGDRDWSAVAMTPEGQGIRTVQYRATLAWMNQQGSAGWGSPEPVTADVKIEYPDKMRVDPVSPAPGTIVIRDGDRELSDLSESGGLDHGGTLYLYMLARPVDPMPSPDLFTVPGVTQAGLVHFGDFRWYGLGPHAAELFPNGGHNEFARQVESGANGERVLVVTHTKADYPSFRGTYRIRIDPVSGLVLGWENRVKAVTQTGASFEFVETVEQVEYNQDLAADTFRAEPPANVNPKDVLDEYSPEGLARSYERKLQLAAEPATAQHQLSSEDFARLDILAPADRERIIAKLKEFGVEPDESAIAEQAKSPKELAEAARLRAEIQTHRAQANLPKGHGMSPPLTREQTDELYRAQAIERDRTEYEQALRDLESQSAELERMLAEQAQAQLKETAAEQALLTAEMRKVKAELQAVAVALQRAQKEVAAAQAAAKQGDEEARTQLKEAEAQAAAVARQKSALLAERARIEAQLARAERKAGAAAARMAEAQRALAAQRAQEAAKKAGKEKSK
jgi:hypothetical protein